ILSTNWVKVLQYFHSTDFNQTEPLFNQDISFYVFTIPIWELLKLWGMGLCIYSLIAVCLIYLLSGDSLSQGYFPGFSNKQQRHLCANGGVLMLLVAFSYWLSRYELLYSTRGITFGASYTDAIAQLPANNILCILGLVMGVYLLVQANFLQAKHSITKLLFNGVGIFVMLAVMGVVVPIVVQYLIVQPNELPKEQPYIERTIALTRQAFNLDMIDAKTFDPKGELTEANIVANDLTIRNIRLWDQQPLLQTNRQLQQIRLYYQFPDADIDRYTVQTDVINRRPAAFQEPLTPDLQGNNTTEQRQVLIAARELDYNAVPQQAQTWINRHLIYTHGYGFTLSPVNVVGAGGLPEYFVKDIGGEDGALTTSSEAIRNSIPIGQPRIYFGETNNAYVMTGTKVKEFDYPSGRENVYNIYDGQGGISIGSLWRRLLFSIYFKDWRVLLTREILPQTEVLFRRNINERIRTIAPFLRYDRDPYLVVADTHPNNEKGEFYQDGNYLYWIIDAYTTSEHYPYSDANADGINYIRNSVKVVVDAYNGTVDFYVADTSDPIIASWQKIFPRMFKPLSAMPINLRGHIRYPVDYFQIQSERLLTYHMTDAQVFYNREDQWQIPKEIYGSETRQIEPYFLITNLPNVSFEEFILLSPYTPRGRTNLIAWLAARADGENYGKLLLYVFPKERLIYGTEQIEARINQDPIISGQISLWNRQGSRVIQGNLLVIPIEQSLLYVEPIYLEATQNSLPTLVRVVVAYENRIVMAQTLEQALKAIFQPQAQNAPAIIRPLEEPLP
ncbi:MAG: COG1615 family transporter, partial [Calothrix sp. SM1_7_51]|nr:COG1615 family transporter [Calothrix sp. SM1_7_51]